MIEIAPEQYEAVRAEPRRFVICSDDVYPTVEVVVEEGAGFVGVEKIPTAADVAESLREEPRPAGVAAVGREQDG